MSSRDCMSICFNFLSIGLVDIACLYISISFHISSRYYMCIYLNILYVCLVDIECLYILISCQHVQSILHVYMFEFLVHMLILHVYISQYLSHMSSRYYMSIYLNILYVCLLDIECLYILISCQYVQSILHVYIFEFLVHRSSR